ncbi:dimethylarginine dimethylaminohydrolase family protein [Muriicola marianensis]|uniref:arginine deiminase n=1 Tax=Muriicola marianensis TaxID=1324801 RepID=A0ABQ1QUY0_9FLAO|nr:arginine deiminase family protein [Muriicola marianensis]GGD47506.1 amidinotransferase [Muriicola marianensis]
MPEKYTSQSEYLPLDQVLVMPVAEAFQDRSKIEAEWEKLNYLELPDLPLALAEYQDFMSLLRKSGAEIFSFAKGDSLTLDAVYCRDASIVTDQGVILCRMGKEQRQGEPLIQEKVFETLDIPILGRIEAPGTLEGGDVAWLDRQTLAVGRSYRTNSNGIEQLTGMMRAIGVDVITVALPHFRGPSDVFHLMSILSPLDRDLAAVYSPLMPIAFRNILLERGYQLVEVPESEFDSLGCNILATGPRQCVMAEGNPITEAALRKEGCTVSTYTGNEVSVKGGGGPTCLTRPLRRRI